MIQGFNTIYSIRGRIISDEQRSDKDGCSQETAYDTRSNTEKQRKNVEPSERAKNSDAYITAQPALFTRHLGGTRFVLETMMPVRSDTEMSIENQMCARR
jgi:hypothetical protein